MSVMPSNQCFRLVQLTCKILVKAQNCNYSEIVPKKSHLKVSGGC